MSYDTWQAGLLQIFKAVYESKPFIMNVYHCVDREQVEKYLEPLTYNLLVDIVEEQSKDLNVDKADKDFIARVYSYTFVGLMLDWIKDDMKGDPKILVEKLALVIKDSFRDALIRFQK